MTLKEMREELRALRKAADHRPISRMKKSDISEEIEKLKLHRESTPAVASFVSAPVQVSKSAVKNIKEAKKAEFPVEVSGAVPKEKGMPKAPKAATKAKAPKEPKEKPEGKSKMEKLMALMKAMEE